ncbi:bifunctional DNA primase/helicase [Bacteroides sp. 51]|uniref:bifunctional DNA primase/helicase n=1 Tax=Bacteroides sp. 51 TaxID=2302938 RepID=UPI0013CF6026|nr:bifunctional DNA primase/helicase [Bacteroides sp. 51]NDV84704.1 toprim domain-containing protein [Bacteroides sp. 51]
MINFSKFNINTNGRTSGRMKTHCPQCHDRRRDKRDRSLSVNLDTGLFYCHYCNWKGCGLEGGLEARRPGFHAERSGSRAQRGLPPLAGAPRPQPAVLDDQIVQWFQKERNIPASTLIAAGVTSSEQYMPQTGRKELCICFNYHEGGRVVNTKFRDLNKNFKLVSGAELIPYNLDSILGQPTCTIVEGEMDALACITAGITEVVSVPGGANCNLSWMDRFVDSHFADKQAIYICVDTDRKGQQLRDELLRRLGPERCRIVDLSPAKDANEVLLLDGGAEMLRAAFAAAPETPLEGVYTAEDLEDEVRTLFENGLGSGADTGWRNLDQICTFELGRLAVVTGIPGAGKSEFVDELVLRLNLRHHWRAAYFSPENMPMAYHIHKLAEKLTGSPFRKGLLSDTQFRATLDYLNQNICSILPQDDFTARNILATARQLVYRRGIRLFVLDPVNCIDHDIPSGQSETQYMNAFLSRLAVFARRHRCLVILVAHPRKMQREPGMKRIATPDMYDINGSAAFYNKADFGLIVERNREAKVTRLHVQKVKFRHLGQGGTATYVFNASNGRFTECDEKPGLTPDSIEFHPHPFDNSSWLQEDVQEPDAFQGAGESEL